MGMRNHIDPFGGLNPLVDRVIGPRAYQVVRFVAERMPFIQKVASEPYNRSLHGRMLNGITTTLAYPPLVRLPAIFDSVVWLVDPVTGIRYKSDSGHFTVAYTEAAMIITLKDTAPATLLNAEVLWYLTAAEVPRA